MNGIYTTEDVLYLGDELHQSHVLLYFGFDQTAAGYENPPLRRCPFCRGWETLVWYEDRAFFGHAGIAHRVVCGNCGTTGPLGHTETQAVERWNGRGQ